MFNNNFGKIPFAFHVHKIHNVKFEHFSSIDTTLCNLSIVQYLIFISQINVPCKNLFENASLTIYKEKNSVHSVLYYNG